MQIVYAQEPLEKSIFLAGPTLQMGGVPSWRKAAAAYLESAGFDGKVFTPEPFKGRLDLSQADRQIAWEWEALNQATVVVFWVPRELATMPAFTTNIEFGLFAGSSKVLLGFPESAVKIRYLHRLARRYSIPVYPSLESMLDAAVEMARNPYPIGADEPDLPL